MNGFARTKCPRPRARSLCSPCERSFLHLVVVLISMQVGLSAAEMHHRQGQPLLRGSKHYQARKMAGHMDVNTAAHNARTAKPGTNKGHKHAPQIADAPQQHDQPTAKPESHSEPETTTKWYELAHYVDKSSIKYDVIRVFSACVLLFAVVGSVSWCCYRYFLVPCGICEDYYFDSPRDFRIRDGRGAFMPLTDAMDDEVWDSASSIDSDDEYIRQHSLEDEYGEFNMKLEEKNMFRASDTYHDAKSNGSKSFEMVQRNSRKS